MAMMVPGVYLADHWHFGFCSARVYSWDADSEHLFSNFNQVHTAWIDFKGLESLDVSSFCRFHPPQWLKKSASISFPLPFRLQGHQARITHWFPVHGQEFRHRRLLRFNLYWATITNDGTFLSMTDNSISKTCHWFYGVYKLLYKSHSAHIVLTLWRLGADKSLLESAYKRNRESQKAAFASPNSINQHNWRDFVGDERYCFLILRPFKRIY